MNRTRSDHIAGLLAFFEIWNFPLTLVEIRRFFNDDTISEESLKEEFFWTADRQTFFSTHPEVAQLLETRRRSERISGKLTLRAEKFLRILRHFPFIRALAITNTPAMRVASSESDIDLFVAVQPGRIWTARFFSTLFFFLLGLRARKGRTSGKFCLSFFVDEEHADLFSIKNEADIYLAMWLATMRPFCGERFFQKLQGANRNWVRQETGIFLSFDSFLRQISAKRQSGWQKFWEFLLPRWAENIFRKILLRKARKFRNPDSPQYAPEMIFEEHIQKLHHPDLRSDIQKLWQEKMKRFSASRDSLHDEIEADGEEQDHAEDSGQDDHENADKK